jgi:hypothetical protein
VSIQIVSIAEQLLKKKSPEKLPEKVENRWSQAKKKVAPIKGSQPSWEASQEKALTARQ